MFKPGPIWESIGRVSEWEMLSHEWSEEGSQLPVALLICQQQTNEYIEREMLHLKNLLAICFAKCLLSMHMVFSSEMIPWLYLLRQKCFLSSCFMKPKSYDFLLFRYYILCADYNKHTVLQYLNIKMQVNCKTHFWWNEMSSSITFFIEIMFSN